MVRLPDTAAPLSAEAAAQAFADILDARTTEEAIADFLIGLSQRGETSTEIAEAARALRARLIPIEAPSGAIDVCGTGGDGHHTLNVSTAVSLVVAAAGVPVAAGVLYPFFGILISPIFAAAAMTLSSISVIGNALRLRAAKI